MRECLWKIPELSLRSRIVFLRKQPEIVSDREQTLKEIARFLFSAHAMQTGNHPERARQKHAFSARQSVHTFFFGPITKHETVLHELALDRFDRPAHSLIGKRQEPRKRHHEQTRIEGIRSVILRKGFLVWAISPRANFGMDFIANLPPPTDMFRRRTSAFLHQFNSAIESDPRHHFGMSEMFRAAAHFPNSLVRLIPI